MSDYLYGWKLKNDDIIKWGSTRNLKNRLSVYKTGLKDFDNTSHDLWTFKILNNDVTCYQLDKLIQVLSKEFNQPYPKYDGTGGTEFYKFDDIEKMKKFLTLIGIKYEFKKEDIVALEIIAKNKNDITVEDLLDSQFFKESNIDDLLEKYRKLFNNMKKLVARIYQLEARNKALEYLKTYSIGKIIMPCGSGKSFVMFEIVQFGNFKKVLVLVPSLYLLTQIGLMFNTLMKQRNINTKMCFIGSDVDGKLGDYDIFSKSNKNDISNFIKKYDDFIIVSTYQSCKVLKYDKFDLIIFDEAHKTATCAEDKNTTTGFNHFVLNYKESKKLYFTATEKYAKLTNQEDSESDIVTVSMDDEKLYGKTIYSMTILDGIKSTPPALSDYTIIISNKSIEELITNDKINEVKTKYKFKKCVEYYLKAMIIRNFIKSHGITHIITKHSRIEYCDYFVKILKDLINDDVYIDTMDGTTSMKNRSIIITKFVQTKISILCNAKCLNEGVDIPIVDCVVPVDDMESTIDIIQFIGRALRIHDNKQMAYILIPMLVSENIDIVNVKRDYNLVRLLLRTMSDQDTRIKQWFNIEYTNKKSIIIEDNNEKKEQYIVQFDGDINEIEINAKTKIVKDFNKFAPECFEKAREFVRTLTLQSRQDYYDWCDNRDSNFGIPKNADSVYSKDGWISWKDYLGSNKWEYNEVEKCIKLHNNNVTNRIKQIINFVKYLVSNKEGLTIDQINEELKNNNFEIIDINKIQDIKCVDGIYSYDDETMQFMLIDTKPKYNIYATKRKMPLCDELDETYKIDYKKLFGIDDQYLSWKDLLNVFKEFANNHEDVDSPAQLYEMLRKERNDIPIEPDIYYKDFEGYYELLN